MASQVISVKKCTFIKIFCLYLISVHENMSAYASRWFLSTVLSIKHFKWQYFNKSSCQKSHYVFTRWQKLVLQDFRKMIPLYSYRKWFDMRECRMQSWLLIGQDHCYHAMLLRGRSVLFLEKILHIIQLDAKWLFNLQKVPERLCQEC